MNKLLIYFTAISLIIGFIAAAPNYTRLEPEWARYPAVKAVDRSLGVVLGDIESHLPSGHPYKESDRVTWAHEGSHGINSYIRNEYQGKVNALYCLHDRTVVLLEPNTTIAAVAKKVPMSLRGNIYNLYLIKSQSTWNDRPLYLVDEFVAYTNGSLVGLDLVKNNKWKDGQRNDTIQYMLECSVYCLVLSSVLQDDASNFKIFMRWQMRRTMQIYQESKRYPEFSSPAHEQYIRKLQTSSDAESLRNFTKKYFNDNWTKYFLGF
jgi:hypothetical protein